MKNRILNTQAQATSIRHTGYTDINMNLRIYIHILKQEMNSDTNDAFYQIKFIGRQKKKLNKMKQPNKINYNLYWNITLSIRYQKNHLYLYIRTYS